MVPPSGVLLDSKRKSNFFKLAIVRMKAFLIIYYWPLVLLFCRCWFVFAPSTLSLSIFSK